MEFLGHRRAADDVAAFEHADLQPRAREIEGADQAVMPAADDQRVVSSWSLNSLPCGGFGERAMPPPRDFRG